MVGAVYSLFNTDVMLVGDALAVVVIREERTGELRRSAPHVSPIESDRAVSHEIEGSVRGGPLVFSEF